MSLFDLQQCRCLTFKYATIWPLTMSLYGSELTCLTFHTLNLIGFLISNLFIYFRLQRIATSCLADYVFENCGQEAAEFLETITILQTPPACESRKRKFSKEFESPENNSNNVCNSFLSFLILFIIHLTFI